MCRQKKVTSDTPISELAVPFLRRKRQLSELDFAKNKHAEVALYCLNADPTLLKELSLSDAKHLALLKYWVQKDFSNYLLCLQNQINHIDLLSIYLNLKLRATVAPVCKNNDVSLLTSYDGKLLINYKYETKKGETISYFDTALGVPTELTVSANVKFKLVDALKLVQKIDIDVRLINMLLVTNFITESLNGIVRDTILSRIIADKLTFYDLPQHYTSINRALQLRLYEYFAECGLTTTDFSIIDISIPNNMGTLLQNQFFAIAEAERVKMHEQKMEKISLDLYERKAEIHEKYPDFPMTLTEAEKDFALNRYLTRCGKDTSLKAEIDQQQLSTRKIVNAGTETQERKIEPTTITTKSRKSLVAYLCGMGVLFIVALCMFAVSTGAGLISLAVATLIAGLTAIFTFKTLKYGKQIEEVIGETDELVIDPVDNNLNVD